MASLHGAHANGMYQRTNSFSTGDADRDHEEIDLMEILQEIPDDSPPSHSHPHAAAAHRPPNGNEEDTSSQNTFVLIVKGLFAFVFAGLMKLHLSSRIVHQFLILHFTLTSLGLSQYLQLSAPKMMEHHQYWRLFTCSLAGIPTAHSPLPLSILYI